MIKTLLILNLILLFVVFVFGIGLCLQRRRIGLLERQWSKLAIGFKDHKEHIENVMSVTKAEWDSWREQWENDYSSQDTVRMPLAATEKKRNSTWKKWLSGLSKSFNPKK